MHRNSPIRDGDVKADLPCDSGREGAHHSFEVVRHEVPTISVGAQADQRHAWVNDADGVKELRNVVPRLDALRFSTAQLLSEEAQLHPLVVSPSVGDGGDELFHVLPIGTAS